MALSPALVAAYRHFKPQMVNGRAYWPQWAENKGAAQRALMYARQALWQGQRPTPKHLAPVDHLREVGFSDDIIRLDYTGWYCDTFAQEIYRGMVFQVSGKRRRARYVVGYQTSWDNHLVASEGVIMGDILDSSYDEDDGKREAARRADSVAESDAEKAREYDQAWQAGAQWATEGESIAAARKDALALLTEWKAARKDAVNAGRTALCDAIREKVQSLVADITRARARREELAAGNAESMWFFTRDSMLRAAFNEGAGEAVLS